MKKDEKVVKKGFTIFILLTIAVFICLQSPLNIFSWGESGTDSSVFRYVAYAMQKDQMPYRDTFDHKGPLLFLINYIGMNFHYYKGIWCIEVCMMFLALFMSYKTALLFTSRGFALFSVLTAYSLMDNMFRGGNLTEEYALCFIAASTYCFIKFLMKQYVRNFEVALCGACFGAVCLLRINMIAVWAAFGIIIVIYDILKKEWKNLCNQVVFFLTGFAMITIPVFIYYGQNGALKELWDSYIVFNLRYTGGTDIWDKLDSIVWFMNQKLVYCVIGIFIYVCYLCNHRDTRVRKIDAWMLTGTILAFVITIPLMCMSGRKDIHYGMVLIPILLIPISWLCEICSSKKADILPLSSVLIIFGMTVSFICPAGVTIYNRALKESVEKYREEESQLYADIKIIADVYCDEDDTISVFGNKDYIYLLCDRLSASRYSYQFPLININPLIYNEYLNDLEEKRPKIVIIEQFSDAYADEFRGWLVEKGYSSMNSEQTIFIESTKEDG